MRHATTPCILTRSSSLHNRPAAPSVLDSTPQDMLRFVTTGWWYSKMFVVEFFPKILVSGISSDVMTISDVSTGGLAPAEVNFTKDPHPGHVRRFAGEIWRNLYLGELANCLTENLGMWQKKPVNWAWEELKIAGQLNSPRKRSEKQPETHHGRHGPPEASSSHLGFTFIRVDLLRDHVHQVLGRAPLPSVDQGGFHSYGMLWLWL